MTEFAESTVRDVLLHQADRLELPEDPWPRFASLEHRHRRTRGIRIGVITAVVAAGLGIQTNVIPLPGWMPSIATASSSGEWAHMPTRGSLATDREWLDGLRRQVKEIRDPEGFWKGKVGDRIKVVYADDVPGHRLALVLVPLQLGLITSWNIVWYEGPPGAAPNQMRRGANDEATTPVSHWVQADGESGGVAVVIGPPDSTVAISPDYVYSAKGVLEHPHTRTFSGGVAVMTLAPSLVEPGVTAEVKRGEEILLDGTILDGWTGPDDQTGIDPTPGMLTAAEQGARGPELEQATFNGFVVGALRDCHLAAKDVKIRLRWSGTLNGQSAALFTIQPTGGGVLAYAYHGGADLYRMDMRLLLPAAGADQRPIAWRVRAEGTDRRTDQVIVVAPPNATAVAVTVTGKPSVAVALDTAGGGTTTVPKDASAVVTAYDASGASLASTPVPPFEIAADGLPGESPLTRVVS